MLPAKMLPSVVGMKFFQSISQTVASAPARRPRGIMYIFAGMCSKPMATKHEMGNQMPTILPAMSCACVDKKTAMHTIQLQPMPYESLEPVFRNLLLCDFL